MTHVTHRRVLRRAARSGRDDREAFNSGCAGQVPIEANERKAVGPTVGSHQGCGELKRIGGTERMVTEGNEGQIADPGGGTNLNPCTHEGIQAGEGRRDLRRPERFALTATDR